MQLPHFLTTAVLLICTVECCSANVKRTPEHRRIDFKRSSLVPVRTLQRPQTHQNYKRRNVPDNSRIIFPTEKAPGSRTTSRVPTTYRLTRQGQNSINEIPISLFSALNNVTNQNDFSRRFTLEQRPIALGSSGIVGSSVAFRSSAPPNDAGPGRTLGADYPFAQPAVCTPQMTTVPIEISRDPYDFYFPSCTRIDRCGGCCSHQIFECAPIKTENVTYQVIKTTYLGPELNKFDVGQPITVTLVRHVECQCQCKVKVDDCNSNQVYRPNECRCECINQEEAANCNGDKKFWDVNLCLCRCRERSECSTGLFFNSDTCMCERAPSGRMGVVRPGFRDI